MEAAARPLPSEDTTPPVTKMYFADMSATSLNEFWNLCVVCTIKYRRVGRRKQWVDFLGADQDEDAAAWTMSAGSRMGLGKPFWATLSMARPICSVVVMWRGNAAFTSGKMGLRML